MREKKGVGASIALFFLSELLNPDVASEFAASASFPCAFGAELAAAALASIRGQCAVSVVSWVIIKAVALRALWLGNIGTLIHANKVRGENRRQVVCVVHRYF